MAKQVTPSEAAELLSKGWKYLDVRSIPEFEQGHPEGAANVPLLHSQAGRMIPNPEFQQVIEANFAKDDQLVIGCKMSGRSAQAVAVLEAAGYTQVAHMRGGFSGERDMYGRVSAPGWAESGLPVATQPGPGASYAELVKKKK